MMEYSSDGYEDELDEDLEALLYSQVHYGNDDAVDQMSEAHGLPQHVFTVTPLKTVHSSVSVKQDTASVDLAVKHQSQLFESVPFDCEDPVEVRRDDTPVVDIQRCSALEKEASVQSQTPDVIYLGTSDTDKGNSSHTHQTKTKFDIEAELGLSVSSHTKKGNKTQWEKDKPLQVSSSQTKKGRKKDSDSKTPVKELSSKCEKRNTTKGDKDTPVQILKSSAPKFLGTGSNFIKIEDQASQAEKDYRKTLNQLLTSRTASKKARDIVVIKSDSTSSGSTSDSDSSTSSMSVNESAQCDSKSDSSSDSTSESDVEVLGSVPADQSTEPSLDLNWNVTTADRQTIERLEKSSSQVEDSKWKISEADLAPVTRPKISRYYAKKEIRCRNCDKQGHLSKICPQEKKKPVCSLCGTEGHIKNRCPHSLCFNCNRPGHRGADCPRPRQSRFTRCARCQGRGHAEDQCPDLWRQYHLTITSMNDLTPSRKEVNKRVFCCNCAKQGHFAHECRQERMDKYSFPPSPFIMKYDVVPGRDRKGASRTRSADRESHHKHKSKRFKSDHHHSYTPQQSQDTNQSLYPRGSGKSVKRSAMQNQRYFDIEPSTHSTPHQHHTPSYSSTSLSKQKVYSPIHPPTHHSGSGRRPYLSVYAKKFMQRVVEEASGVKTDHKRKWSDPDRHFDWQGEDRSAHPSKKALKRQGSHAWENNLGATDGPTPPKKRKGKNAKDRVWTKKSPTPAEDTRHSTKDRNQSPKKEQQTKSGKGRYNHHAPQRTTRDDRNHTRHNSLDHGKAEKHTHRREGRKKEKRDRKPSLPPSSTSTKGMESLTITCKAGFRTTVKTMNLNRNSRNAQF